MTTSPADHDGIVEPTDTGAVLRFERHLHHPVEAVWAAVTEPSSRLLWQLEPVEGGCILRLSQFVPEVAA